MGATRGAETANSSRAPEYTPGFNRVMVASEKLQPIGNSWHSSFLVINIVQILNISNLYISDVKNNTIISKLTRVHPRFYLDLCYSIFSFSVYSIVNRCLSIFLCPLWCLSFDFDWWNLIAPITGNMWTNFANIARPLHKMCEKGSIFQWNDECEQVFLD
jgi:hypothetical protein